MGKRLGQHFLHSEHVLAAIVQQAALTAGEPVLEVGPGPGALTERLLAAQAQVTAVEVDPVLAQALQARWGGDRRFRLVEGDILKIDLAPQYLFGSDQPYAVIANLPYYLSTPLLFRFIAQRARQSRLLLMVQQEVADRLVALPEDGKVYGSLSVAAHCAYRMRIALRVPPGAFRPPPKVHSAVVAFTPLPATLAPAQELAFQEHVKMLFAARRKRMASTLGRHEPPWPAAALAAAQALVGERRPEALTPAEHLRVFRLLTGLEAIPAR
jgi:16S rRNA (adenine1518-N6/adenine1519-N6)-dimethyltransferase